MKVQIILRIVGLALVALVASVGLWMYLNGYLLKSKASNGVAIVGFVQKSTVVKGSDKVHGDLTVTTTSGISGIDISFSTVGTNLTFSYADTIAHIPPGFEMVLDESTGMVTSDGGGNKTLKRIVLISKNIAPSLPKSALIPLYFTVISTGQAAKTTLSVNTTVSQIIGVSESNTSGTLFSLEGDGGVIPSYTVEIADPRAASATRLECDIARNSSTATCGRGTAIVWKDVANDEGYKIYKNNKLVQTVSKDSSSYYDNSCINFLANTYSVIAFNTNGSISTTLPTVSCACLICPTAPPPTPTPMMPTTSSDLIFRVVFPDALATVGKIPDVKITILDNAGKRVCPDDMNCEKVVSFTRVLGARTPNTFASPQLQYSTLTKNQAYSVIVKQSRTVRQTYKNVYLKWQKVLQCNEGSQDSGCGDLIGETLLRPLFSGDLDGSNTIDQKDADIVGVGLSGKSVEGDLNFDNITDQKDVDILGKNFNKKGT